MARVPITIMGFRCERCSHEWLPKGDPDVEPKVCPKCHSPYWNAPKSKKSMSYEAFRDSIVSALQTADNSLTWTEIRTKAGLPQLFPNNQWVHRMEKDSGLLRQRDQHGIIHWQIPSAANTRGENAPSNEAPDTVKAGRDRKPRTLE